MTKREPRSKAEQRAETLDQMLDAAEELFSRHGLHGVTLKDVANKVSVHTTLMHYYFKDKASLFEAVFARRANVTSQRRMEDSLTPMASAKSFGVSSNFAIRPGQKCALCPNHPTPDRAN